MVTGSHGANQDEESFPLESLEQIFERERAQVCVHLVHARISPHNSQLRDADVSFDGGPLSCSGPVRAGVWELCPWLAGQGEVTPLHPHTHSPPH